MFLHEETKSNKTKNIDQKILNVAFRADIVSNIHSQFVKSAIMARLRSIISLPLSAVDGYFDYTITAVSWIFVDR